MGSEIGPRNAEDDRQVETRFGNGARCKGVNYSAFPQSFYLMIDSRLAIAPASALL